MIPDRYERRATFAAAQDNLFAWHEAPGALERLMPPWENARVVRRDAGLEPGVRVHVRLKLGPFWLPWDAEHVALDRPHAFEDIQARGPFKTWHHTHRFTAIDDAHTELHDDVRYELHGGALGRLAGGAIVRAKLERMFAFRHRVLTRDLARHANTTTRLRIGVTGSSGLIGEALCAFLTTGGHSVVRLVRRAARGDDEVPWDPARGVDDPARLEGLDGFVHLAGEPISAPRWSEARRRAIDESRGPATERLVDVLAGLDAPPRAFIAASGIGAYRRTDDGAVRDESSPIDSSTFLGGVAARWEAAAARIEAVGSRRVSLRLGVVLSPRGGALARLLPPTLWAFGGRLGAGTQRWSWVSLDDVLGAIHHALIDDDLHGPVNVVAPAPTAQIDVARTLARVVRRPAVLPVPAGALRARLGERAGPLVLDDLAVRPTRLLEAGFVWQDADLEGALRHMLGRVEAPP